MRDEIMDLVYPRDPVSKALSVAYNYSQIDGAHHKAWVIDQMVRALTGDRYEKWVKRFCTETGDLNEPGEENFYEWDEGIAP